MQANIHKDGYNYHHREIGDYAYSCVFCNYIKYFSNKHRHDNFTFYKKVTELTSRDVFKSEAIQIFETNQNVII